MSQSFPFNASRPLRIGTRGSVLAIKQAEAVAAALLAAFPALDLEGAIQLVPIRTSGDRIQDRTLREAGGKGLFTKEIEDALLEDSVDVAVHSMKDLPTWLPEGLEIAAMLPRADPRDVFLSKLSASLDTLPEGAVVGTASLRRQALVLSRRPDLTVVPLRGNVDTRLQKLADGVCDATLLALAGLERLGRADLATTILEPDVMLPAVAQGVIGMEIRTQNDVIRPLIESIGCSQTGACVLAERSMLAVLDGSCRTPIAGLARITKEGRLHLDALVARPDGSAVERTARDGTIADAQRLGSDAGAELKSRVPANFFAA